MISHIVLVKFNPGITSSDGRVQEVADRFKQMPLEIKEIKTWESGFNFAGRPFNSDWALYSQFRNEEDFKAYLQHPAHLSAVKLWAAIATWTYCDFRH